MRTGARIPGLQTACAVDAGCVGKSDGTTAPADEHNLLLDSARRPAPPSTIAVTCRQSEKEHRITVSDTGPGISDEDKTRVFDLFYRCQSTGTPPTEGSGIGLSLVARIAQRLGGHITLTDHHPQGTAFTLHLPKERGQA